MAGAQKFALLNITARMQPVEVDDVSLLDPQYGINIWLVFPDRIYLEAKGTLIRAPVDSSDFAPATAAGPSVVTAWRTGETGAIADSSGNRVHQPRRMLAT